MLLSQHIEALIFASEQALSLKDIKECLEEVFEAPQSIDDLKGLLDQLVIKYSNEDFPFEIQEINGGYQFLTKPSHHRVISVFLKQKTKKRLSQAAMETLAVIAYKQPVSKGELEQIRGVNCDYSIQKLLEKELIAPAGRSEGPGKPLLYATSDKFMDYFGLKALSDLPKLKELSMEDDAIGTPIELSDETVENAPNHAD